MPRKEKYELFPLDNKDAETLDTLILEISEVLRTRADGISIEIQRDPEYPYHKGKALITQVLIKTWDCVA